MAISVEVQDNLKMSSTEPAAATSMVVFLSENGKQFQSLRITEKLGGADGAVP